MPDRKVVMQNAAGNASDYLQIHITCEQNVPLENTKAADMVFMIISAAVLFAGYKRAVLTIPSARLLRSLCTCSHISMEHDQTAHHQVRIVHSIFA